jgi:hypothetical protein
LVIGERRAYVAGLDLGQKRDYSAISLLEVAERTLEERDPVTWEQAKDRRVRVVYLERVDLGTPYPDVVTHVAGLMGDARLKDSTLVVDATGVGAPVVDMLRKADLPCRLMPVTITGGEHDAAVKGGYHVPKRELLTGLQVLVQSGGLQIPRRLMLADALIKEMVEMKEGSRDDLVLATSLAWWWARKTEAWRGRVGRVV